ncbi:MAG: hypothetical protein R2780_06250 [Crocinitomicaceae bacterium]|nr:hypothetical protein [Crocinitomicaceae bacterium]
MPFKFQALIFFSFLIVSCSSDPLDVDVSEIELDIQFDRFEQKMFSVKSEKEMYQLNADLIESGGELYEFYVHEMLHAGSVHDDSAGTFLYYFVSDSMMRMTYDDISNEFRNFELDQEQMIDMFKHLKYHLPDAPLPKQIITYNSAFNYGVVSTNDRIGIGLDMYLGQLNRIVKEIGFPVYMKEKMSHDYLLVDVAHSWLITNVMGESKGETFLSQMIYYGKLRYMIDAMLPDMEDHYKIRYTQEEYDWSMASEDDVWLFIMDMNWVYSTDMKVLLRFFEEAPTTVGIEGSPGRLGQFMGWMMVKQYMEKNEDVTVAELLAETNESKFLKNYKPDNE